MGRRYLRESEDKIDAVELERYIWSVAEDCAKNIKEQLLEALEKDYFEKDEFGEHIEIDVYLPSTVRKNTLPYFLESFLYKDAGLSVLNLDITLDQEDKRTGEAFIWFGQEYDDNKAITEFIDYTETGKLSEVLKEYIESIILYDIIMIEESRSKRVCKKPLRESGDKITEDDIQDYIYKVAQSTADNLDFEIDYRINNEDWADLDIIEDGEVDAEMIPLRIDLKDDYAIKYKAIADWVDDEHYDTDDFDMYAYVSKDFVLGSINGDNDLNYEYEAIEFMFGSGGSIKNVYMNDTNKITKEIYTRLEQELKSRGIYDLVGKPKVELNESRKCKKVARKTLFESYAPKNIDGFANYLLDNARDTWENGFTIDHEDSRYKKVYHQGIKIVEPILFKNIKEISWKLEFNRKSKKATNYTNITLIMKEFSVNGKKISVNESFPINNFNEAKEIVEFLMAEDKKYGSLKESKRKSFRGGATLRRL